jgi:hypothetical protein
MRTFVYTALFILLFSPKVHSHNTWYGTTGLVQVPTTGIGRLKELSVSAHSAFGRADNYTGLNLNYAVSETTELAVFTTDGLSLRKGNSTALSIKHSPVPRFAVGATFDASRDFRNTLYGILGSPYSDVYLGLGTHFGDGRYAMLGNYSSAKNKMESVFFMAGARMDLSDFYPSLEAMVDFNGDTMSAGLGLMTRTGYDLQLDYQASGDLHTENRFVFSVGRKY